MTFNPVTQDPFDVDLSHPQSMMPFLAELNDTKYVGNFYLAGGKGAKPTILLLHGFPGSDVNADLAYVFRRAGFNTLIFHYRGTWGSSGTFSWKNAVEDVEIIINAITTPQLAEKYNIDPGKLIVIGHSMGGFAGYINAAKNDKIKHVAVLAGFNFGYFAKYLKEHPEYIESVIERMDNNSKLLNSISGKELWKEINDNIEEFDLTNYAPQLSNKNVFIVSGKYDLTAPTQWHHKPLVHSLEYGSKCEFSHHLIDAGHSFGDKRIFLADFILFWLNSIRFD